LAKKATRKQAAKRTTRSARSHAKTARRPERKTARKKTAARATATRKRRARPAPKPASKTAVAVATARGVVAGAVTAVVERLPWSSSTGPDGLELLEQEHRRFEELLKQGEQTTERAKKGRRELLETLTAALDAHELMEESVLYPALHSHPEARDVVLEGFEEHHIADLIVKELQDVAEDDEQWGAKFKVLKENVEHHIKEEEGEMFRVARGLFSREELRELAVRMVALKPSSRPRRRITD
jgi:hemerythrin-like domain-containing protein